MHIQPVTLEGRHVRLEPLTMAHFEPLCSVASDPDIWRWTFPGAQTPEQMRAYIELAVSWQNAGTALPFATVDKSSGKPVGSTRFANIERAHRRVEIGWTWIAPPWQRTVANTEAKYLMLRYAFESFGCIRVEFKTDSLNEKSRRALLRIGAQEEGILRNHMIAHGDRIRHSVYYSIIDSEWPAVKANLEAKLAQ
jgi:N-acetyltransferase